jgi:hypothetical protein
VTAPTAGEITVRRCVVRVTRRGGWSWGPDPRSLVQQAIDALPDLLAAQYDEHLAGDGPDLEITEPVVLSVRWEEPRSPGRFRPAEVMVGSPAVVAMVAPVPTFATTEAGMAELTPVGRVPSPLMLFGELAERGELATLLALLPVETLRVYLSALLDDAADEPPAEVISRLAAELGRRWSLPTWPETYDDIVELVGSLPGAVIEPAAALATAESLDMAKAPAAVGEARVSSVLPFLLAGPLARTGYLDAIGPALAGVGLLAESALFAAALAYQVLGAPQRGWRRTPEDNAAAAAFAGLESIPDLTAFADRVRPALPVLDGVLALSLCRGHDPEDPLLITGVDGGLLLVDAQGMFPIAWAVDVAGLLPHWATCGRPPVLVRESPLPSTCLRDLASAGVPLITSVRPLRDEPLSRLPWHSPLWTYGAPPRRLAAELPAYTERLEGVTSALFAVPRMDDNALDRSASLAVSLALGMIAWTLWHNRETTDPALALTRFADLEATIQYTSDSVRVRLPLGRRHADLWQSGLLTDVPDVVWLGGRTLTFSGG